MSEQASDPVVERVIAYHRQRVQKGIGKYGTTLDGNMAGVTARLRHIQEEAMDAAAYCEWAIDWFRKELNKRAVVEEHMIKLAKELPNKAHAATLKKLAVQLGCSAVEAEKADRARDRPVTRDELFFEAGRILAELTVWADQHEPADDDPLHGICWAAQNWCDAANQAEKGGE